MTQVILVNEDDTEVGIKDRDELIPSDIYRITLLWITNSAGDILLAQRALTKKKHPGLWGPAVAGTVEAGETYDSNIVKEALEEIGLMVSLSDLTRGPKNRISNPTVRSNSFVQSYLYTIDRPIEQFTMQEAEVMNIKWFKPEEIKNLRASSPELFIPTAAVWFDLFLK